MTNITTGKVRLSYVHLTKPYANMQGQEEKYSVTVLLPKSDVDTKQRLDAAIEEAAKRGTHELWNGVRPPVLNIPIHDGDGVRPSDGMPFGDECKGHWVFTASAKKDYPPEIVDANLNPIINHSEIYSGIYARVALNVYPYFFAGKKGLGIGLGPVQKLSDGEPLGGSRVSAASAFGGASGAFGGVSATFQAPQYGRMQIDPITGMPAGGYQ